MNNLFENSRYNGFTKLFLRNKPNPRWLVFLVDTIIVFVAILIAYLLRFNFQIPQHYIKTWKVVFPLIIILKCSLFFGLKLFAGSVRYSGLTDFIRILTFGIIALIILSVINTLFISMHKEAIIPLSVLLIDFILSTLGMMLLRIAVKYSYEQLSQWERGVMQTVLIGSWENALLMMQLLELDRNRKHKIIAIFDKDRNKNGFYLKGIPTYTIEKFSEIIEKESVEAVVLQKGYLNPDQKLQLIDYCLQEHIRVMTVPNLRSTKGLSLSIFQLKELQMEDLLEREPIKLNLQEISRFLIDRSILITGAAGSIGSEIVKQIASFNPKILILVDQAESPMYELEMDLKKLFPQVRYSLIIGDICDKNHMEKIFAQYKPEIVYHAAAYKHVPLMEENPCEAFKTNVLGTVNLVQCSLKYQVTKFIMISTDKAVNPTNVMGATKRLAEMYVQASQKFTSTKFITTRFGNVIGSNGSAVLLFKRQIENGGPVTITHPEVTRFFMTIPEACQLVLEASMAGKGGEIFVFDMGERIKILDLATKMIKLSGFIPNEDIKIVFTGLRPGEKLYEELIHDKENNIPTYHPKIMIARTREINFHTLHEQIQEFQFFLNQRDAEEIVRKMKELIPEYVSNNSKYCLIDNQMKEKTMIRKSNISGN